MKKNLLYFVVLALLVSCKKDEPDSVPGFIEKFINDNPRIGVSIASPLIYGSVNSYASYRGYVFKPLSNIKINAIGGRIAETGVFKIIICEGHGYNYDLKPMLIDSINISNIDQFQYKNISKQLILSANNIYTIIYLNKTKYSIFDAGYKTYKENAVNAIELPLLVNGINIESTFCFYGMMVSGGFFPMYWIEESDYVQILRGLVDFKYEVVK